MFLRRLFCFWISISFISTLIIPPQRAYAQSPEDLGMPAPGVMISLTPAYVPVIVKGLRVHPENPILFDFIVDTGNSGLAVDSQALKGESEKLIKYFLASLTIPDEDLWVNLSPYEKNRIIPEQLGQTEMGRDMLAQDYILKQLTASLIYPEKALGKEFWSKVYAKAQQRFGSSEVPVNTFNKVWILPDKAGVYVHDNTAFVVESHLRVMLEEDYLSLEKHNGISHQPVESNQTHSIGSQIVRQIVLPELEKEVNTGKNFATLRQIFNSMILATWYKKNLKEALLNQVYSNKAKINGVDVQDKTIKEQIYREYLRAYKKGVFNYIKEDIDQASKQVIPRKYFSGGLGMHAATSALNHLEVSDKPQYVQGDAKPIGTFAMVTAATPRAAVRTLLLNRIASLQPAKVPAETPQAVSPEDVSETIKGMERASLGWLNILDISNDEAEKRIAGSRVTEIGGLINKLRHSSARYHEIVAAYNAIPQPSLGPELGKVRKLTRSGEMVLAALRLDIKGVGADHREERIRTLISDLRILDGLKVGQKPRDQGVIYVQALLNDGKWLVSDENGRQLTRTINDFGAVKPQGIISELEKLLPHGAMTVGQMLAYFQEPAQLERYQIRNIEDLRSSIGEATSEDNEDNRKKVNDLYSVMSNVDLYALQGAGLADLKDQLYEYRAKKGIPESWRYVDPMTGEKVIKIFCGTEGTIFTHTVDRTSPHAIQRFFQILDRIKKATGGEGVDRLDLTFVSAADTTQQTRDFWQSPALQAAVAQAGLKIQIADSRTYEFKPEESEAKLNPLATDGTRQEMADTAKFIPKDAIYIGRAEEHTAITHAKKDIVFLGIDDASDVAIRGAIRAKANKDFEDSLSSKQKVLLKLHKADTEDNFYLGLANLDEKLKDQKRGGVRLVSLLNAKGLSADDVALDSAHLIDLYPGQMNPVKRQQIRNQIFVLVDGKGEILSTRILYYSSIAQDLEKTVEPTFRTEADVVNRVRDFINSERFPGIDFEAKFKSFEARLGVLGVDFLENDPDNSIGGEPYINVANGTVGISLPGVKLYQMVQGPNDAIFLHPGLKFRIPEGSSAMTAVQRQWIVDELATSGGEQRGVDSIRDVVNATHKEGRAVTSEDVETVLNKEGWEVLNPGQDIRLRVWKPSSAMIVTVVPQAMTLEGSPVLNLRGTYRGEKTNIVESVIIEPLAEQGQSGWVVLSSNRDRALGRYVYGVLPSSGTISIDMGFGKDHSGNFIIHVPPNTESREFRFSTDNENLTVKVRKSAVKTGLEVSQSVAERNTIMQVADTIEGGTVISSKELAEKIGRTPFQGGNVKVSALPIEVSTALASFPDQWTLVDKDKGLWRSNRIPRKATYEALLSGAPVQTPNGDIRYVIGVTSFSLPSMKSTQVRVDTGEVYDANQLFWADHIPEIPTVGSRRKDEGSAAMTPQSHAAMTPGGIDLNTRNMQLDENGEKINIKFDKAMIAQFESGDFSGVRPDIKSITPITSVFPMLGLKEPQ